jgi:hypothetical protein
VARAVDDPPSGVVHQRSVDPHHRVRRNPRPDIPRRRARLLGDQRRQGLGVAGEDLLLARQQRRARDDHAGHSGEALAGLGVLPGEQPARGEHGAPSSWSRLRSPRSR